ncbi:MAG: membrane protein of unknown function, partial [Caulobacteraceae bacterium]
MVAIFTGRGAGLERGSAAALGAGGLLGSSALGRAGEGVFLNAANGNLVLSRQDEFLIGRGPDVAIARTYNSQGALDDNGDYWRQSTDRRVFGLTGTVNTAGSTVKRVSADGSEITYTYGSRGDVAAYWSTDGAGAHDTLVYRAGDWTWTEGSTRISETYRAADNGFISAQRDLDGNAVAFSYAAGKLTRIATANDASGAQSAIEYGWTSGHITSVITKYTDYATSPAVERTLSRSSYAYDALDRLVSVMIDETPHDLSDNTAAETLYTVAYTYDGSSRRVASITQTDGSSLAISYDGADQVIQFVQTVAAGDVRTTSIAYFSDRTEITDPRGQKTTLYINAGDSSLSAVVAPPAFAGASAQETSFLYDADGNVVRVTDPSGAQTQYEYDVNGNATKVTDANGNVVDRVYDANNSLVRETRTGAFSGGGSAALHTRYVYDGENHLRYAISAEGHVTEYRYLATGELQQSIEYPRHAYPTGASVLTEADMNLWRDGLADRSSAKIVDYHYDARGNADWTASYGAAATSGAGLLSDGYHHTFYIRDQAGQLLQRYDQGNSEYYVYDGLGRVIASTNMKTGATAVQFSDASTQTTVTTASGYTTVSTYNKAGDLVSVMDSGAHTAAGTTQYLYDRNGRVRREAVTVDAAGTARNRFFLYDNAGRKIADIGHDGNLVEYRYDRSDRLVATARYATTLSTAQIAALADPNSEIEIASIRPAAHGADIWQWTVYDAVGRVVGTIGGDGSVTRYEYDAAGRLVATLGFHNKLTAAQIAAFIATAPVALVAPAADGRDVVLRTFYDRDGRVIGALNAEGHLSRIVYDSAGQKIEEIAYANATAPTLRQTGSFEALLASFSADPDRDVSTRYAYDGQGQLRFTVDAVGRVTEYIYHAGTAWYSIGNLRRTVAYATAITPADYSYESLKAAVASAATHIDNRSAYSVYNARGLVGYAIDASGAVTGFAYDSAGRVTSTTQYKALVDTATLGPDSQWLGALDAWTTTNREDARITRNYYSARGEFVFTIDAEGYVSGNTYTNAGQLATTARYENKVAADDAWTTHTVDIANKGAAVVSYFYYDNAGRLAWTYDGNGDNRHIQYLANGTREWEIVALGQGVDESRTRFEYDLAGRLIREIAAWDKPEQAETTYAYDGLGNLASTVDAGGVATTFVYDKAGRLTARTDAAQTDVARTTSYEYDAFGRGVKTIDALGAASYAYYDRAGRLTLAIDAEGYATATRYTGFGEVEAVTRHAGRAAAVVSLSTPPAITLNAVQDATTSFTYDKLSRAVAVTDAETFVERAEYNAFGDKTASINKRDARTTYEYDARGLLKSETYPVAWNGDTVVGATNTFTRDSRGNVVKQIEALGLPEERVTEFGYDGANRLVKKWGQEVKVAANAATAGEDASLAEWYEYNRRGERVETRTGTIAGSTETTLARTLQWRDALGRVTHEMSAAGAVTRRVYDANGNVKELWTYEQRIDPAAANTQTPPTPPGASRVVRYDYDALGRLTGQITLGLVTARFDTSEATPRLKIESVDATTHFAYDAGDNLRVTTDPNGATTYAYFDRLGRKTAQVDAEGFLTAWDYDAQGNALREHRYAAKAAAPQLSEPPAAQADADNDRVTVFEYDRLGRREKESRLNVEVYAPVLDAVGVQIDVRQVRHDSVIDYTFNALGQVTLKREATGDAIAYRYDDSGRMLSEERSGFVDWRGVSVQPKVEYAYNAHGDLTRTRALDAGDSAERVSTYAYDNAGRLARLVDAGGYSTFYVYDALGRTVRELQDIVKQTGTDLTEPPNGIGTSYDLDGHVIAKSVIFKADAIWQTTGYDIARSTYNGYGEVTSQGLNDRQAIQISYDNAGRVWRTNADGGSWKYFLYDAAGNQTVSIASDGADISEKTLTQVLDLWGVDRAAVATTNVAGVVATITRYDQRGLAVEVIEPQRQLQGGGGLAEIRQDLRTNRAYDAFGAVTRETSAFSNADNPDGATISYRYNTMGKVIETISPKVSVTSEAGVTTTANPTEQRYYDAAGRLIAWRDANGNLTEQTLLAGTGYGGAEALVASIRTADGATVSTGYDIHGDVRRIVDQLNRVTSQSFDRFGRLTEVARPVIADGVGLIDTYAYDGRGQRIRHANNVYGAYNEEITGYDLQGRVISQRAFGGDTTTYSFLWKNTIATAGMAAGGGAMTFGGWEQTTTWANGRTSKATTDQFGREVTRSDLKGRQTDFTYDLAGRLVKRAGQVLLAGGVYVADKPVVYSYFNTGRLAATQVRLGGATATHDIVDDVTRYAYDAAGAVVRETSDTETGGDWWEDVPRTVSTTSIENVVETQIQQQLLRTDSVQVLDHVDTVWQQVGTTPVQVFDHNQETVIDPATATQTRLVRRYDEATAEWVFEEVPIEGTALQPGEWIDHRQTGTTQTWEVVDYTTSWSITGYTPVPGIVGYQTDTVVTGYTTTQEQIGTDVSYALTGYSQSWGITGYTPVWQQTGTTDVWGVTGTTQTWDIVSYTTTQVITGYTYQTVITREYDELSAEWIRTSEVIETPVYATTTTPVYGWVSLSTYGWISQPVYGWVSTPQYDWISTPVYTPVYTPIYQSVTTPVYGTVQTPVYGTVQQAVYGWVQTPNYAWVQHPVYTDILITPIYRTEQQAVMGWASVNIYRTEQVPVYQDVEVQVTVQRPVTTTSTVIDQVHHEITVAVRSDQTAAYDGLGRLTSWRVGTLDAPEASIAYRYDANGNVRASTSQFHSINAFGDSTPVLETQESWFRYDALNRVVTSKGELQNGQIVRGLGGVDLLYDDAGQRASSVRSKMVTSQRIAEGDYAEVPGGNGGTVPMQTITRLQVVTESYSYDGGGRLRDVLVTKSIDDDLNEPDLGTSAHFDYDVSGRLTMQTDFAGGNVAFSREMTYNAKGQVVSDITNTLRDGGVSRSQSTYSYGEDATGGGVNYALGAAVRIDTTSWFNNANAQVSVTTNEFEWYDSAVQAVTRFTPPSQVQQVSTYAYDQIGGQAQLKSVSIQDGRPRTVAYQTDANGQVIRRDEQDNIDANGDPHEQYYRFAGREMGRITNDGGAGDYQASITERGGGVTGANGAFRNGATVGKALADFDQAIAPITSFDQGSAGGAYTVREGETLASIASGLWGDSSLWYKIAEANGLSGAESLTAGQSLILPVAVQKSTYNASTFKPYDPAEAIGDTSPTSPVQPRPPKKNKCGVVGQILLVVIAVAVTIYTAGAASGAWAGLLNGTGIASGAAAGAGAAGTALGAGLSLTTAAGWGA